MQQNIFDFLKEKYKINKPIRLIELFGGIGCQALALEYLNVDFEHYKLIEFDKYCIQTYNQLHNTNFIPLDITKIKGEDLEIKDTNNYEYILTYSYPCQSLSLAGKQEGMAEGSNTKSSLLWEVKRLFNEIVTEGGNLPQVLLMENVTQVHSKKNIEDFKKWINFLENLGYSNYYQDLNAKNYGIPQNRDRTFMISLLGNYYYEFPKPFKLELRLKDMLEDEVDEKYYLSNKAIEYILDMDNIALKSGRDINNRLVNPIVAKTISCRGAVNQRADVTNFVIDNYNKEITVSQLKILIREATKKGYAVAEEGDGVYINRPHQKRGVVQKGMSQTIKCNANDLGVVVLGNYSPSGHNASRIIHPEGIAPTVMENHGTVTATVVVAAKRGRGDGWKQQIEVSDREYANAITTVTKDSLVTIKVKDKVGNEIPLYTNYKKLVETVEKNEMPVDEVKHMDLYNRNLTDNCGTLNDPCHNNNRLWDGLRIRKLTPRECFRLMGIKDESFDKIKNLSNTQAYKQAGNGIVVNVLMEIFKKLIKEVKYANN